MDGRGEVANLEIPCGLEMILNGGNIGSLVTEIID
jgi:hypothetical protein